MKQISIVFSLFLATSLFAQDNDTTIYKVVSEMARFPGCEQLDTTVQVKNQCAQTNLLLFFNQNISYPLEARNQELEGQVVLSFVVEKDGYISDPRVLRDIGGGCGDEALRVANGMNEALKVAELAWKPGMKDGKPVRSLVTLPIKFKLQDPLDYILINFRDTIYTVVDDSLNYPGGHTALLNDVQSNLKTPNGYQDSCKVGTMDLTVLVKPDGYVRVVDLTDYWGLGIEYQWQTILAGTSTWGKWNAAKRNDREVPSSYDFTVEFLPSSAQCSQVVSNYELANSAAVEGVTYLMKVSKRKELRNSLKPSIFFLKMPISCISEARHI